jgi:hypothetical protein
VVGRVKAMSIFTVVVWWWLESRGWLRVGVDLVCKRYVAKCRAK